MHGFRSVNTVNTVGTSVGGRGWSWGHTLQNQWIVMAVDGAGGTLIAS